jgi:hypothetical protein
MTLGDRFSRLPIVGASKPPMTATGRTEPLGEIALSSGSGRPQPADQAFMGYVSNILGRDVPVSGSSACCRPTRDIDRLSGSAAAC